MSTVTEGRETLNKYIRCDECCGANMQEYWEGVNISFSCSRKVCKIMCKLRTERVGMCVPKPSSRKPLSVFPLLGLLLLAFPMCVDWDEGRKNTWNNLMGWGTCPVGAGGWIWLGRCLHLRDLSPGTEQGQIQCLSSIATLEET